MELISTNDTLLPNGIIFNEETKILLAEKFVHVQFMVPYPKFDMNITVEIRSLTRKLSEMWEHPSFFCNLDFSTNFNTNDSNLNVDWLLDQVEDEIAVAKTEVSMLYVEANQFLQPGERTFYSTESNRQRRSATIALAAMASVGLFGSGVLLGGHEGCGIMGIFGTCQDKAKENAENIAKMANFVDELASDVHRFRATANEKFFMVSKELSTLETVQNEMIKIQNENWKVIDEQFETFSNNIHRLRDCTQVLYSRQQINFNLDSISSLLALAYTNVKSYRSALYAFRMNLLTAIPTILKRQLPMSLVSKESLNLILETIAMEQAMEPDRLSLAIPLEAILSYYESQLLKDAISTPEGLLLTLSMPLASSQTVYTVYRAHSIPMPQPEEGVAIRWKTEADYIAISENQMETAPISTEQLSKCIGSSSYQICQETIATEMGSASCLSALYFKGTLESIQVCETEKVYLPTRVQATNLGHGVWLLTARNNGYTLRETTTTDTTPKVLAKYKGCNICIITLECGRQLQGDNIKIRSDLGTCQNLPAIKVNVKLPDPLAKLISVMPGLENLPNYRLQTDASVDMLRAVRDKLQQTPVSLKLEHLEDIAKPIAGNLTSLKSSIEQRFETYAPYTMILIVGLSSFLFTTILNLIGLYIYHRCAGVRNMIPKFFTADTSAQHENFRPVYVFSGDIAPQARHDVFFIHKSFFEALMEQAVEEDEIITRKKTASVPNIRQRCLSCSTVATTNV